jgi:hypothetical protein
MIYEAIYPAANSFEELLKVFSKEDEAKVAIDNIKENKLKNGCEMLSKKEAKYKEVIPLANLIWDLHIGRSKLISFKAAVNETTETYGLTPSAALDVINLIIDHRS